MFNNLNESKRRRKRNKFFLDRIPYNMSTKPTRYGPGTNISTINSLLDIQGSTTVRYPLQTLLLSNSEFSAKKQFFRYFKILEIRLCFFPSGVQNNGVLYINLTWNAITYSLEDLQKDDNTKMISQYRTRNKVFRWLPIKGVINVNSISQDVPTNFVDVSDFISTDRVVSLPGWLYISNLPDVANLANLEIKILFRGNDYGTVAKQMIEPQDLFKIKKEIIEPKKIKEYNEQENQEEKEEKKIFKDKIKNQEEEEKNISEEEEEEEDKKLDKKKIVKKKIKKE